MHERARPRLTKRYALDYSKVPITRENEAKFRELFKDRHSPEVTKRKGGEEE